MFQSRGFTFVVGFLSLFWIGDAIWRGIKRENVYEYLLVLALFLFGFSYIFLFPQLAYVHEFTLFYLVPFFAVSAALALKTTPKKVLIFVVIIFLAISLTSMMEIHSLKSDVQYSVGNEIINTNSKEGDMVFVQALDPLSYYADIPAFFFSLNAPYGRDEFILREHPKFVVYYTRTMIDVPLNLPKFNAFLNSKNYTKLYEHNIVVWQLHHPPLVERLITAPSIQHPINANFSNKIEFLGYDIDKTKWEIYDVVHVTYYWKCLECLEEDYTVFVHFTDKDGKIIYQQDHPFCHGAYPTSEWKKGEIIKEEYYFPISTKVKEAAYEIRIGVYIPHNKRMDVITTEGGTWDGWRLIIGEITIDIPWEFKYKTHTWLISTLCIYLAFLGFYRKRFGFDV
jgi:hypothetical protein